MPALRFSPRARAELAAIARYVAEDSPARARALVARIEDRCEILKSWPLRGRLRPEFGHDIHSFAVSPFVVFYRLVDDGKIIEVAAVIDGRRDLGTVFLE